MNLIVDANELFSAIISKGRNQQTKKLDILFSDEVKLHAPSKLFRELEKHAQKIKQESGFSNTDFQVFITILKLRIKSVPTKDFLDKLPEAENICPDPKDIVYFALALKLDCAIWSGEKKLKEQSQVEVYNTKDLIDKFGL